MSVTEPIQKLMLALDKLPKVKKFDVSSADNATPFIVIEIMQAVRDAKDGIAHLARFAERWCEEADRRDPTTQDPTAEGASSPSSVKPSVQGIALASNNHIRAESLSTGGIVEGSNQTEDTSGKSASAAAKASVSPARRRRKPRTRRSSSRAEAPRTKEGPGVLPPPPRATPETGPA